MRKIIARLPWVRKVARVVEGYFVIRASGVFDGHWYRQRYRSARCYPSPILHYLVRGAGEGCDPNPLFDTAWYAKVNRDVSAAGLNPLVHFLRHGALEKRNPCRLFDTTWYLSQQHYSAAAASNPLGHYLAVGWKESRSPHEQFDACRYLEEHPDVREVGLNPLVHYRLYGQVEGRVVHSVTRGAEEPPRARSGRGWKIVIVSGEAQTPGHVYRAKRLAQAFEQRGHEALVMPALDVEYRTHEVDEAHALVIWRAGYSDQIASAISRAHSAGAKVVFDVDDLMIDPALAKTEVIDGIRSQGFTESGTADHYRAMQQTMLAADFCTCPTAELAGEMRRFQKAVFVVPNGFDEQCYEASRRAVARRRAGGSDGLVRIGYAGGSLTHQRDFARAAPALARLLREHPECRLVLFRYESPSDRLPCLNLQEFPEFKDLESKIEWRRLVPLSELPAEMARFDINIAPLETGNVFCEAKSALKYFEAALVDVPTVASRTGPFVEAIRDGQTGFLAESQQEWYTALKDLVTRPDLRSSVGRKACLDVLWRFGPERRAELVEEVYQQVIDGGSPAAARCFALGLRRDREPRHSLPELSECELAFESGTPAQSPVAVVVPLYNYAQHVAEALDSVRAQTIAVKELVIVEDRSTDDSLQVALEWLKRNAQYFSRTALLRNRRNSGLALSRNAGFAFTDARFVLPLDPDNRIHPDFLQRCLAEIRAAGAAAAYATIQEFEFGNRNRSSEPWKPQKLVGGNYIDAMALIRRSAWAAVGGYQRMKVMGWEDFDLWCRLAEDGLWAVWVPETLAEYRVHEKSMLATHTDLAGHRRILGEEMCALHPWLDRSTLTNAREAAAFTAAEKEVGMCPPEASPQAVGHQPAAAAMPASSTRESPPAAND